MSKKQQELSPLVALQQQAIARRMVIRRKRERQVSSIIDWDRVTEYTYIQEMAERTGLTVGQVSAAVESLNAKRNPKKKIVPKKGKKNEQ